MANLSVDQRTGKYTLRFRWAGVQFTRSCETKTEADALATKARVEDTIKMLKLGRMQMPADSDPGLWIMSDGKVDRKSIQVSGSLSRLGEICDGYILEQHDKAETTLVGERVHIKHLREVLNNSTKLQSLTLKDMQTYIDKRSRAKFRGRPTSGSTIRKELVTFTQIWAWAKRRGYVVGNCPIYDEERKWAVEISKPAEKEKFQTWSQIEKRINRGGLSDRQQSDLWASLFLDNDQVIALLEHVKEVALHSFIYPMYVFAAYTGVRRSEICRSQIDDFDFDLGRVKIREKKRKKSKSESFRFVDLHPVLAEVMEEWFAGHPGGQYTIVAPLAIARRKAKQTFAMTSVHEAHHHFKKTIAGSKWDVIKGFHVLRHSFGSNLARAGIPAAQIAAWMGHTTQEMIELYQHLFPQDGAMQISALR